jgi:hypothetical protein
MNIHKNARLTLARRLELVLDITVRGREPVSGSIDAWRECANSAQVAWALSGDGL